MKRKLTLLIGAILLALAVTVGTYAYTFTTTTITIDAAAASGEIVTHETAPNPNQPDWNEVLPESETDQEILLPNAAGDLTEIPFQFPIDGAHWDKVDDISPDEMDTYVSTWLTNDYRTDLYRLTDHTEGIGTVTGITVTFRFDGWDGKKAKAKAVIKTNGEIFEGSEAVNTGGGFITRAYTWGINPVTGEAWTWEDIDNLQAGVSLKGKSSHFPAYCTQVYVVVDYELPPIIEGDVPEGRLFTVTPHPDYPGDLLVNIYMTNTGFLKMAYQHLNMKVYVGGSLEAEKDPEYQILSLENGMVSFNIEGGSAASYNVEVIGGGYGLVSGDPYEWGEGWNHVPELYCEVSQR
ncbi:hypothetical protein ACFLV2_00895 [Chloroflexota bacterium]